MTALAHEVMPVTTDDKPTSGLDLDEILWQAWKAMELPEGYQAEIIEGSIEVSPTGRRRHGVLINRFRRALEAYLEGEILPLTRKSTLSVVESPGSRTSLSHHWTWTRSPTRKTSASMPPASSWS